jgi:hopanoid biosynthesis associated RND transporter like protein HpnN
MISRIDSALASGLTTWVDFVARHARLIAAVALVATLGIAAYTAHGLGVNSDNLSLIPEELPSRRAHEAFIRHFPNLEEALFVVVDAATPELAREAAADLTARFEREPRYFSEAYLPAGGDFFERNGLLYRSPEELDYFADQVARMQPLVAEFESNPSLAHMAEIVRDGLDDFEGAGASADQWILLLDRIGDATVAVYQEHPVSVSWEELLLEGSALEISTRRAIVVHPVLDYADLLQGRRPIERIRQIARELGFVPERGVSVRITGNPALNYEEMIGFAIDIGIAGVFCFVLVTLILQRAFRSPRIVLAALVTLVCGLVWTAGFATLALGELNLLSLTFAILFIGLGVDFCIHLGTGYSEGLWQGHAPPEAMRLAASRVGTPLAICTVTTAIGFYVFVPTEYRGVGELGLIAGTGMFIIFFLALTLFPALLGGWLQISSSSDLGPPPRFGVGVLSGLAGHGRVIRWGALAAGIVGLALIPRVSFDPNVVELRDPGTESVQAFHDLLERSETSPWYLNTLMPDLPSAQTLAQQLEALETVDRAITLASYVPDEQEEKLEILGDLALLFDSVAGFGDAPTPVTPAEQVEALRALEAYLEANQALLAARSLAPSVHRLQDHLRIFLDRVEREGEADEALADLETLLLDPLPSQLARLRRALEAETIDIDTLPERLRGRMQASDGTARVQIFPSGDLRQQQDFRAFVEEVQRHTPNTAGVPLNLVEFGRVTESSFRQALISAVLIITLLLTALWRDLREVLLVMLPLCLGAVLTVATMAVFGLRFNFANVIVIPLLFGIGVDSGIHMIERARRGESGAALTGSATARAIYFSAFTTAVSFGSLSLADHRGLESLGIVLTIGLFFTVTSVLIVLPALLELTGSEPAAGRSAATSSSSSSSKPKPKPQSN